MGANIIVEKSYLKDLIMRQLSVILWKNILLKKSAFLTTILELFIPVAILSLLVLIKNITEVIDSPPVAYFCGNSYPWFYNKSLYELEGLAPFLCLFKPLTCSSKSYYNNVIDVDNPVTDDEILLYGQNGMCLLLFNYNY